MGAKQSKRSVDISGKEAESAGEVAAAGAGGEGRVEPLADADALKPQLNGAAHIQPDQPLSDKEKQLDSGTPENEKDATTEKESKEEQNEQKEVIPVTNGDNETKEENGDPVPTPEDGKKPKKEKVKKKWSLRSISFSRKDKPKQEKKSKEEEPKTNGEPEKLPEEAAEAVTAVTEAVENKIAEVVKADAEVKEEKTPETPVTEPLTNGSSTPESPKVETLAADEPAPAPEPDQIQETPVPELKPEQLPVNGLSLEEPKTKAPEIPPTEEAKPEESAADATVTAPVPEIPVKTEVCDAKMPLIEPTPPPLPANPPPSSVASFAATTMAPELIEASLANTTENLILTPPAIPNTKADKLNENETEPQQNEITNTDLVMSQLSPPMKETAAADTPVATPTEVEIEKVNTDSEIITEFDVDTKKAPPTVEKNTTETKDEAIITANVSDIIKNKEPEVNIPAAIIDKHEVNVLVAKVEETKEKIPEVEQELINNAAETMIPSDVNDAVANCDLNAAPIEAVSDLVAVENEIASNEFCTTQTDQIPEPTSEFPDIDELPPPLPLVEQTDIIQRDDKEIEYPLLEPIITEDPNANQHRETNGIIDEIEQDKIINKKKDGLGNTIETIECNGNAVSDEAALEESNACSLEASLPASGLDSGSGAQASAASLPPPPAEPRLQDPLPIADKIADLIPEIPTVPELNTESELASQVAVAD